MKNSFFLCLFALFITSVTALEQPTKTWDQLATSKDKNDIAIVKKITSAKWWNTCSLYGKLVRSHKNTTELSATRSYLESEDMLNAIDVKNIADKTIQVGMSQCGVFASIGIPNRANNHTNAAGSSAQLVYENSKYKYIYTEQSKNSPTQTVRSFSF